MRDAQLVMPKAVSAAMAAWITARRICVQVIFLDSWLDLFMEISVFCQFKMRMEQKEVTELADGHGGVKESYPKAPTAWWQWETPTAKPR